MSARELPEYLKVPWGIKDAVWLVVWWLVAQFVLGILLAIVAMAVPALGWLLDPKNVVSNFSMYVLQVALGLVLAWWLAHRRGASWEALGWRRPKVLWAIALVVIAPIAFIVLASIILYLLQFLIPGFDMNQAQSNEFTDHISGNTNLVLVALVILPPIFEETIFRGFIFPAFAKRTGLIWAAIISSALFGLAHFQANISVYTMVLGLFLCLLYVKTRSIIPGILVHMINNYAAFWSLLHK